MRGVSGKLSSLHLALLIPEFGLMSWDSFQGGIYFLSAPGSLFTHEGNGLELRSRYVLFPRPRTSCLHARVTVLASSLMYVCVLGQSLHRSLTLLSMPWRRVVWRLSPRYQDTSSDLPVLTTLTIH